MQNEGYRVPKHERGDIVVELRNLGLPWSDIERLTGWPATACCRDIRTKHTDAIPKTDEAKYAAVFTHYTQLWSNTDGETGAEHDRLFDLLEVWLDIESILHRIQAIAYANSFGRVPNLDEACDIWHTFMSSIQQREQTSIRSVEDIVDLLTPHIDTEPER